MRVLWWVENSVQQQGRVDFEKDGGDEETQIPYMDREVLHLAFQALPEHPIRFLDPPAVNWFSSNDLNHMFSLHIFSNRLLSLIFGILNLFVPLLKHSKHLSSLHLSLLNRSF